MGSNTTNLSLYKPDIGEEGWADDVNGNFDTLDENVPYELASGTETLSGGSTPALNTTIPGVSTDQLVALDVIVSVDSDPAFSADYAFNYDWSQAWDNSSTEVDVVLTVNWDTDPGTGNDVTISYSIQERTI